MYINTDKNAKMSISPHEYTLLVSKLKDIDTKIDLVYILYACITTVCICVGVLEESYVCYVLGILLGLSYSTVVSVYSCFLHYKERRTRLLEESLQNQDGYLLV